MALATHQLRCFKLTGRAFFGACLLACLVSALPAHAQVAVPSMQPLADPVLKADAELRAQKVSHWETGGIRYLLLENDVELAVGTYGWRATRALVRIENEYALGRSVNHFSMYLENAQALRGRGATQSDASRLLVTASTRGDVDLVTDLLEKNDRSNDAFVTDGIARHGRYVQSTLAAQTLDVPAGGPLNIPMAQRPRVWRPEVGAPLLTDEEMAAGGMERTARDPLATPTERDLLGGTARTNADGSPRRSPFGEPNSVLPTRGIVSFRADRIVFREEGENKVVVLIGHVRVVYQQDQMDAGMSLAADNAVIFLADAERGTGLVTRQISAGDVQGVYLEENVIATNGDYTVRSPRVFYDLRTDRAVLLDAVMYTWDVDRQIPLYVRADKLMQQSRTAWSADRATLTTSEFAEPHFSIAARNVTVNYEETRDGRPIPRFTATDSNARIGKMPVFYWPKVSGNIQDTPLRRVDFAYSSEDGFVLRTKWDVFAAAGKQKPDGVDAYANIDYLGTHGPGLGVDVEYDREDAFGRFNGYFLALDDGDDDIADRNKVKHNGDQRGMARFQHRQYLDNNWELSLELGYVSDETFLEQFFLAEAETEKPFETSVYLKKQERDWAFTFLAKGDINDSVANTATLQAPGYNVDKLPELAYYRVGTPLWMDRLTWYSENRLTHMRARPGQDDPADRGFNAVQSRALFGIGIAPTLDFDKFQGNVNNVELGYITRFDTRQELQMPLEYSIFKIVPYIAGRFTAWSDDTANNADEDNYRFWGAAGVRASTSFERTYDRVNSRLLDLHRMRHIIEPSIDLYYAGSTVDSDNLRVFDPGVEGINQGFGTKLGLRNTLQTQRGGPGRWRDVDWVVLDTDVILMSDDESHAGAIPRYYSYRPEYAIGGDHFNTRLMWMVTDTLASVSQFTYDFESGSTAQWLTGLQLQHSPQLLIHASYSQTDLIGSRQLSYGFDYRLTTKYTFSYNHSMNLAASGDQSFDIQLIRQMPRWKFVVLAQFDNLDDDNIIGFAFVPDGFSGQKFARNLALFNPPN